jgi:hypothetical protein
MKIYQKRNKKKKQKQKQQKKNLEELGRGKQEIYAGGWKVKGCGGEMFS